LKEEIGAAQEGIDAVWEASLVMTGFPPVAPPASAIAVVSRDAGSVVECHVAACAR